MRDCCTDTTVPCIKAVTLALPERSFSTRQQGLFASDCFHEGGLRVCGYDVRELLVSPGSCTQLVSSFSRCFPSSRYAGVHSGFWISWTLFPRLPSIPALSYIVAFLVQGHPACPCHVRIQQLPSPVVSCRACTLMVPLHSNRPSEQCHCSALKRRIGSSGSSASMHVSLKALSYQDDLCLSSLVWLGHLLHAFCISYFALLSAILGKLLLMRFPGKHSPFGRLTTCLFRSPLIAECGALSLGVTRCSQPVLPWPPLRRCRRRRQPLVSLLLRLAYAMLPWCGVYSLPHTVWAAPFHSGASGLGVYAPFEALGSSVEHPSQPTEDPDVLPDTPPAPTLAGHAVDLPPHGSREPPFSVTEWLGVALFAPHFRPRAFGIRPPPGAGLEQVYDTVRQAGRMLCSQHDMIAEAVPHPFSGYLTALSYSTWLDSLEHPRRAVFFDMTAVGGHYCALIVPAFISLFELVDIACPHLNIDPYAEPLYVWQGDNANQVKGGAPLDPAHGTVFTFSSRPDGHPHKVRTDRLFVNSGPWARIDHIPRPTSGACLVVCTEEWLRVIDPSFFPGLSAEALAIKASRCDQEEPLVAFLDVIDNFDHRGDGCNRLAVVYCPDHSTDARIPCLLDARALGLEPRFFQLADSLLQKATAFQLLAAAWPTLGGGSPVLLLSSQVKAGVHVFVLGPDSSASGALQLIAEEDLLAPGSRVTASLNTEPAALIDTPPGDPLFSAEDMPTEPSEPGDVSSIEGADTIRAHFWVLRVNCLPLQVTISLNPPATIEQATDAVALALPHEVYLLYSRVVAVHPQPSAQWGLVLALPQWAGEESVVVCDLQKVDGRLFSMAIAFSTTREQLCGLVQVDPTEVHIYAYGSATPLPPGAELYSQHAGCVFFTPKAAPISVGHCLRTMLIASCGWFLDTFLPSVVGQSGRFLCVVTDQGQSLFELGHQRGPHYRDDVAQHYNLDPAHACIQVSRPRIYDAVVKGYACRGVLSAVDMLSGQIRFHSRDTSEHPSRPEIAFVDCRPMLEGWQALPFRNGRYPHAALAEELSLFALTDYQVQLDGAEVDDAGYLLLAPGQVIVAHYVPITPAPSEPAQDSSPSPSDGHSEDTEEEDHDASDSTTTAPNASDNEHLFRCDQADRSRSRTPRRHSGRSTADLKICCVGCCDNPTLWEGRPITEGYPHTRASRTVLFDVDTCGPLQCQHAIPDGPKDDTSVGASRQASPIYALGLNPSGDWAFHCDGLAQLFLACKLLSAPTCHTLAERSDLQHLHRLTVDLGGQWPFFDADPPTLRTQDDTASDVDEAEVVRLVSAVVLKPLYAMEVHTVVTRLPVTIDEFQQGVQALRHPCDAETFPHLTAVLPQPSASTATFVAFPVWNSTAMLVCVDSTAVDGRLYVQEFPDYVDRQGILMYTDFPPYSGFDVYVGTEPLPIEDGVRVHLFPAVAITICPHATPTPPFVPLTELLLQSATWSADSVFAQIAEEGTYCLILRYGYRIFQHDVNTPETFSDRLAESIGIATPDLVACATIPGLSDVAVDGYGCRAVVIGVPRSHLDDVGASFCFVLDCRSLLQGWYCVRAHSARISRHILLEEVGLAVPLLWTVDFRGADEVSGFFWVEPGSVIQVVAVPLRIAAIDGSTVSHASALGGSAPTGGTGDTTNADPAPAGGPDVPSSSPGAGTATDPRSSPPAPAVGSLGGPLFRASFLILVPQYAPEIITVSLLAPTTVMAASAAVNDQRQVLAHRRFPRLVEVSPQPDTSFGVFVAKPEWEYTGSLVAVDARHIGRSVFAAALPSRADLRTILQLCGLDPFGPLVVYLQDMPWPLVDGQPVRLADGDLVIVVPMQHPAIVSASLSDMLLSPEGWCDRIALYSPASTTQWLVSWDRSTAHNQVTDNRLAQIANIAVALGVNHPIVVRPALPPISDHAWQGLSSSEVLLVGPDHSSLGIPESVTLLLDSRPVLGDIDQIHVPGGYLSVDVVQARIGVVPPFGFQLALSQNSVLVDRDIPLLGEACGTVFAVEYVPRAIQSYAWVNRPVWASSRRSEHRPSAHAAPDTYARLEPGSSRAHKLVDPSCLFARWWRNVTMCGIAGTDRRCLPRPARRGRAGVGPLRRCIFMSCLFSQCVLPTAMHDHSTVPAVGTNALATFCDSAHSFAGGGKETSHIFPTTWPCGREVPTPCRSLARLPMPVEADPGLLPIELSVISTLLEDIKFATRGKAPCFFFETRILLDTLVEHFSAFEVSERAGHDGEDGHAPSPQHGAAPLRPTVMIQLSEVIPLTPFQQEVAVLQSIVPIPHPEQLGQDWLDTDLSHLLCSQHVPAKLKDRFANFRSWHSQLAQPAPIAIEIFTDGSADGANCQTPSGAPCAWAFASWILTSQGRFFLGSAAHTAVPPCTPYSLGEVDDTSLTSELLALGWAAAWAIEYACPFSVPVIFCYDSTVAGLGSFGLQKAPAGVSGRDNSLAVFVCSLRQCLEARVQVGHRHVRGHAGIIENELVDQLSKAARLNREAFYDRCLPEWPQRLLQHSLRDWAWLAHSTGPGLPALSALEAEAGRLQAIVPDHVPDPQFGLHHVTQRPQGVTFSFKIMSYNVLTLFDPSAAKGRAARNAHVGLMIRGKRDVMKRQLLQEQIWLLGLQETRLPESCQPPDSDFLMLSSAANADGHYGCSLWINPSVPFAQAQGKPCKVSREGIIVTSYSPRHLQVQIDTPWIRFTVLVAHGPSAVRQADEAKAFWSQRLQDLARRPEGSEVLLLVDANGRVGSQPTSAVGAHDPETESLAGEVFHSFLLELGCMLPATFPAWHVGQSWTWAAPGADPVRHRIDYIGVPDSWADFHFCSRVWETFESLQSRLDHLPVQLQVSFWKNLPGLRYTKAQRRACRPNAELSMPQRTRFVHSLAAVTSLPWHVDVDEHLRSFVPALHTASRAVQVAPSDAPRQPYLTADTLQIVRQRAAYRRYLSAENQERRRRALLVVFAAFVHAWRHTEFTLTALFTASSWLQEIDVSISRAIHALDCLTDDIRRAVRIDRIAYLQGLVQDLTLREVLYPQKLYAAVRRAFPQARSARRSALRPLPAITDKDGTLVVDPAARNERWRAFFAEQEAGLLLDPGQYATFFNSPDIPVGPKHRCFSVNSLPTLRDIESGILSLQFRKASGPDGVTAEELRIAPQATALCAFPLFLKASLAIREPIEWRGGNLIALAKKVTKALECAGYRSILLASVMGKIHHKVLRGKLEPHLRSFKSGLQAGTSGGVGVDAIALSVKAFRGWTSARSTQAAVTFYDIKAAYYHILRQTLLRTPDEDGPFLRLLHDIGVPSAALEELHGHLSSMALLQDAGVSEHTRALVGDLFRGTWFRLESSDILTGTRRGSRPGDPLADLLFGFSFAGYMKSVDTALEARGLATRVPQTSTPPPWTGWVAPSQLNHSSWADDYVHLQFVADSLCLASHVVASARIHVEKASSIGMSLTFAPDKSATLLSSRVDRSRLAGLTQDAEGAVGFYIRDDVRGCDHFLPVVDSYRHLGGILTANHSPAVDIAFRSAQAWAVLRPLKRRLFGSQSIPLTVRHTVLRSLVVSKFAFSCALVDIHAALHRRTWCKNYVGIWRTLCGRKYGDKPAHGYEVLHHAGATSPLLALAQARATLLSRLLKFGPGELLHLLYVHWVERPRDSWLQHIVLDLRAVSVYSPSASHLLQQPCPVWSFLETLQIEPTWWPRQIKLAVRGFASDLSRWHLAHSADGAVASSISADLGAASAPERPFQCRWCSRTFLLHKHVAVHEARSHGALSPARHYAWTPWCLSCMTYYHTMERVQNHLRGTHACLQRCALVIPPMSLLEVREAELEGKARNKRIRNGSWTSFRAAAPSLPAFGPRLPTYQEATADLDEQDLFLGRMARLFRPSSAVLQWVDITCQRHAPEGPRGDNEDFWLRRPAHGATDVSLRIQ